MFARGMFFLHRPAPPERTACPFHAQAWHELSIGPDSMWKDKLVLLDYQWPDLNLPPDGITQYYAMGGTDPIAWARRRACRRASHPAPAACGGWQT